MADKRDQNGKSPEGNTETREKRKDLQENAPGKDRAEGPSGAAAYIRNAGKDLRGKKEEEEEKEFRKSIQREEKRIPGIPAGGGHTEEDYLRLPDDIRVELINGVFYAMASPSRLHQTVVVELVRQLADCVDAHSLPCFLYVAPSDVALGEDKKTVVQPDVYIHCDAEKNRGDGPYRGAPDFVIEVLSPSNPENDLWRKRILYQRHGVREYWVVDPEGKKVFVFMFENRQDSGGSAEPEEMEAVGKYTFDEIVPVRISGGSCAVDFCKILQKIQSFV